MMAAAGFSITGPPAGSFLVRFAAGLLALVAGVRALAADGLELVAGWDCDEGQGRVLHEVRGRSPGRIFGATWVRSGAGYALRFDGVDDYVDCGAAPNLAVDGPFTLAAWVHPDAPTNAEAGVAGKFFDRYALTYYKTGACYFYLGSGGNNASGAVNTGRWTHITGVFDGHELRFYVNGAKVCSRQSKLPRAPAGSRFRIGCTVGDVADLETALRNATHFSGMIDQVRLYGQALTRQEILHLYNDEAAAKGRQPFDESCFGHLLLEPFFCPHRGQMVATVGYEWVRPLPPGAVLRVELARAGQPAPLQTATLKPAGPRYTVETTFQLAGLADGDYQLCAAVQQAGDRRSETTADFHLPLPPPRLPDPAQRRVPPLPPPVKPPAYEIGLAGAGGFTITTGGQRFRVASRFSHPGGGQYGLDAGPPAAAAVAWQVTASPDAARTHHVRAVGPYYTVDRTIAALPTRVLVTDTITNTTAAVVGVRFGNYFDLRGLDGVQKSAQPNGTVFVAQGDVGAGLVALDDLYRVQQQSGAEGGWAGVRDDHFGLDHGASVTVRWAVYPTATADYFDFINQVRRDEHINGSVAGAFAFARSWDVPTDAQVRAKALKYLCWGSLTRVLHNPTISLEGWEFVQYPELRRRLKAWIAATRKRHPQLKVGFHVAHSLYATDRPREKFADSLAVDAKGNANCYGPDTMAYYGRYFDSELVRQGWRWWLFYPTLENHFGRWMLEAADVMTGDLGANAIWADGYISGYVDGGYTYDRWDGHSVDIDPATNQVVRKKASVTLLALPVLTAVARKFQAAGGVLITNGRPGPFSFLQEPVISSAETAGGQQRPIAQLHLGRTVTPLGNPSVIASAQDIYRDILAKLDLGALYFWYGEQDLVKEPTIVSRMYPITFDSIHAGTVRGTDRIVTRKAGVYGWQGDRHLHAVYAYDARGRLRANRALTTVDAAGVRTELRLGDGEAAVIVQAPVTIVAAAPINLVMQRYNEAGIELRLSGHGTARCTVRSGEFPVGQGVATRVLAGDKVVADARRGNQLSFPLKLDGPATVRVTSAD